MAFDATAVYAGRSMILYTAPYLLTNAPPSSDTIDWGEAWGSNWVDRGLTQEGVEWEISHDYADIEVDQFLTSVLTVPTGQNVAARTNFAEFKADNVIAGVGQGEKSTVNADVDTK